MYGFFSIGHKSNLFPPRLLAHYSALLLVVRLQFSAFILYLPPLRLESLGVPCIMILSYARTTIRTQWWFRLSNPKRREPPPMLHSSSLLPRLSYATINTAPCTHRCMGKGKAKKVFFLLPSHRCTEREGCNTASSSFSSFSSSAAAIG